MQISNLLFELPAVKFELAGKDEEQIVLACNGFGKLGCGIGKLAVGVLNGQIANTFAIGFVEADFDCALALAGHFGGELACAFGKIDTCKTNPIACVNGYAKIGTIGVAGLKALICSTPA